jgi:hypothetical protein
MKRQIKVALLGVTLLMGTALTYRAVNASDHDDGETDSKARALNLTDHFAFRTPGNADSMTLIMYFNPRSLPGYAYFMSTQARYEFHVSRATTRTSAPTGANDLIVRFEATGEPDASGVQPVRMTILKDGAEIAAHDGATTSFAGSKTGNVTTNEVDVDGHDVRWFIGARQDSFHFDVIRFFQVRAFLAARFFGGANGNSDPTAGLAPNCRGDAFLSLLSGGDDDADDINLFNPPECAPDFTKGYNVTAIVVDVPIAMLQENGETIFDTWSTISVPQ